MSDANRPNPTPAAAPDAGFTTWLTVEQIRKMQRMRRQRVLEAMKAGELPYEQRGRIRYARLSDVRAWEERRLTRPVAPTNSRIHPRLSDLL